MGLDVKTGNVVVTLTLSSAPGGGGQCFGDPSDIAIGNSVLVAPNGSQVAAFG